MSAEKIESFFGLESGDVSKIAAGEEVSINFNAYRPSADFDSLKANLETGFEEQKESLKDIYRKEGVERTIKDIRKSKGWDFEGKNIDSILKHQEKLIRGEYTDGVDEQVQNLTDEKSKLQAVVEELNLKLSEKDASIDSIRNEFIEKENSVILNNNIRSQFESFKDKVSDDFTEEDISILFMNKYNPQVKDGQIYFVDNEGKTLKGDLQNPLTLDEVYGDFIQTKFKKAQGGNALGDDTGNGERKYTSVEAVEVLRKQGLSEREIRLNIAKMAKEGKIKM